MSGDLTGLCLYMFMVMRNEEYFYINIDIKEEDNFIKFYNRVINLEVCVPKCHFPGTGFSQEKSGKFPVPSIREHPLPGPVSVPPFGTGQFPSRLSPENETGIHKFEISGKIPEIQYWTGNFLLATEISQNGCFYRKN